MKSLLFSTLCVSAAMVLMLFAAPVQCDAQSLAINIDISPSTLNLSYQGQVVTVHTNIDYGLVIGASVKLNSVEIDWWKADDRGDFVAKFNVDDVKAIVEPGTTAVLTLTGNTKDGGSFSGTSTVRVVSVGK